MCLFVVFHTAAIKEISFIADHIDNLVKDQENVSRMIAIQRCLVGGKPNIVVPGRKLVKEGSVVKVCMCLYIYTCACVCILNFFIYIYIFIISCRVVICKIVVSSNWLKKNRDDANFEK